MDAKTSPSTCSSSQLNEQQIEQLKQKLQGVVLILIGPPASGKGTQAKQLKELLDIPHISTGKLLRAEEAKDSELGRAVKPYLDQGINAPDEFVMPCLKNYAEFSTLIQKGGCLDGCPRTREQAIELTSLFKENGNPAIIAIEIQRSLEGCKELAAIRASGADEIRSDDKPEVVEDRYRVYENDTLPVVNYYAEQGKLVSVTPSMDKEETYQDLLLQLWKHCDNHSELDDTYINIHN